MRKLLSAIIMIGVFSFVIAAGFFVVKAAAASDVSNAKLIEVFWKDNVHVPNGATSDVAVVTPPAVIVLPSITTTSTAASATIATATVPVTIPAATSSIAMPATSSVNTVPAIMAGWQLHRNAEYGLVAQYPAGWEVNDTVPFGGSLEFDSESSGGPIVGELPDGIAEITVYRSEESISSAVSEDAMGATLLSTSTVNVGGADRTATIYAVMNGGAGLENTVVYVPYDGFLYRIILMDHGEAKFSNIFGTFLSVFRVGA